MKFYFVGTSEGQYNFWKELQIDHGHHLFINGELVLIQPLQYQDTPVFIPNNDFNGIDSVIYIADNAKNIINILQYIPEHIPIDQYSNEIDGTALNFLNELVTDIQKGILITPQTEVTNTDVQCKSLLNVFGMFCKALVNEKEPSISSLKLTI
jgi:hypothetical protein